MTAITSHAAAAASTAAGTASTPAVPTSNDCEERAQSPEAALRPRHRPRRRRRRRASVRRRTRSREHREGDAEEDCGEDGASAEAAAETDRIGDGFGREQDEDDLRRVLRERAPARLACPEKRTSWGVRAEPVGGLRRQIRLPARPETRSAGIPRTLKRSAGRVPRAATAGRDDNGCEHADDDARRRGRRCGCRCTGGGSEPRGLGASRPPQFSEGR